MKLCLIAFLVRVQIQQVVAIGTICKLSAQLDGEIDANCDAVTQLLNGTNI